MMRRPVFAFVNLPRARNAGLPIQFSETTRKPIPRSDALPGYSFTPDSRAVVISYGGEIWRVPVDGSAATKIPFTVTADIALAPEVKFQYAIHDSSTFIARQIRDVVTITRWFAHRLLGAWRLVGDGPA